MADRLLFVDRTWPSLHGHAVRRDRAGALRRDRAADARGLRASGGEPNGLTFDRAGRLLVSDGYAAPPSRIDPSGSVERVPWLRGADAAVASDGRVFFSDPGDGATGTLMLDVLLWIAAAAPEGRLVAHDPASGRSEVLLDDLVWPDGVALSPDEDFALGGEVSAYRIRRFWLSGPRAGRSDVFAEIGGRGVGRCPLAGVAEDPRAEAGSRNLRLLGRRLRERIDERRSLEVRELSRHDQSVGHLRLERP